jgi:hypothetical protein
MIWLRFVLPFHYFLSLFQLSAYSSASNSKVTSVDPSFIKRNSEMDKTLAVQLQIRQNAEEISSALRDISSWEKNIGKKDSTLKKSTKTTVMSSKLKENKEDGIPIARSGGGRVPLKLHAPLKSSNQGN